MTPSPDRPITDQTSPDQARPAGQSDEQAANVSRLWAVIPAGGAGTRLWPVSRASNPKFLHDLTGSGRTLIQQTVDRVVELVGERVMIVTGAAHHDAVREQLPEIAHVLAEPSARDSMAAIGLAAAILELEDPEAVIGSFAADQLILEQEQFAACVREAAAVAEQELVVTIGVEPRHPATGFGYIAAGEALTGFDTARSVTQFVEKPDADTAASYLAQGGYLWNAGMFVVKARVLLDLLALNHPELAESLRRIAANPDEVGELWPELEAIAIDHAVAEPAAALGQVAVVPADFTWEDIGDFAALAGLRDSGAAVTVLGDAAEVVASDASGLVVAQQSGAQQSGADQSGPEQSGPGRSHSGQRTVAVLGIENALVVDTGDALLVSTLDRAQDVKKIVTELKQRGRAELL